MRRGNTARFTSILGEYEKAPAVMRQRMYLESMQEIFTRASKVMVDTKSNNNMLYLPLDKIMHLAAQDAAKSAAAAGSASSSLVNPPSQPPLLGGAVPAAPSSGSSNSNTLPRDRASR